MAAGGQQGVTLGKADRQEASLPWLSPCLSMTSSATSDGSRKDKSGRLLLMWNAIEGRWYKTQGLPCVRASVTICLPASTLGRNQLIIRPCLGVGSKGVICSDVSEVSSGCIPPRSPGLCVSTVTGWLKGKGPFRGTPPWTTKG